MLVGLDVVVGGDSSEAFDVSINETSFLIKNDRLLIQM